MARPFSDAVCVRIVDRACERRVERATLRSCSFFGCRISALMIHCSQGTSSSPIENQLFFGRFSENVTRIEPRLVVPLSMARQNESTCALTCFSMSGSLMPGIVTSNTSRSFGRIVPNSLWNRMECKVACRTSFAVVRSMTPRSIDTVTSPVSISVFHRLRWRGLSRMLYASG